MNEAPNRVYIAETLLNTSQRLLTERQGQHEDVLYWAGVEIEGAWLLSTCVSPDARTRPGGFATSLIANARVISYLSAHGIRLLAQVHTHPDHRVGHSHGDDEGAFMAFEGFLSVVVPNYGRSGILPWSQCGVHRYGGGHFHRLPKKEVEDLIRVLPVGIEFREQ